MSGSEQPPPDPARPSTKAAERLAVIVDAAERAALSVIDDAEKEARRYLEEAKVRADLIVAERLREAADMLERHRGEVAGEPFLRPVEADPPAAQEEEAEGPVAGHAPADADASDADDAPRSPVVEAIEAESAEQAAADDEEPEEKNEKEAKLEPAPIPAPAPADPAPQRLAGSAAARLLATQMAVSGASRREIEMRLRNGFEIQDTSEILDAILGPEG